MSLAIVHDPVAAQHHIGILQGAVHVRFLHDVANGQVLRMLPPFLFENFFRTALPPVLSLTDFNDIVAAVIPFHPAFVIGRGADGGRKRVIRIAVTADIQPVHAVFRDKGKKLFHLAKARHGTDMGKLRRQSQLPGGVQKFPAGRKNSGRVVPDVGRDKLMTGHADPGCLPQLRRIDARRVAKAVGNAETARVQFFFQHPCHGGPFFRAGRRILVSVAAGFPDKRVSGQQRHVDGGAVPVHDVQVPGRVVPVDAALAA